MRNSNLNVKAITDRHRFQKVLGRTDIIALSLGTMIGWGWLALVVPWIQSGGVFGAIIAFLAGASLCILIGVTYAELSAALPIAGGEFVYAYRAIGYKTSIFIGWTLALTYISIAAWEGIAISTALNYLFPIEQKILLWEIADDSVYLSWALVGVIGAFIITLLNCLGIKHVAIFQVLITSFMVLIGYVFFFTSVSFGDINNLTPAFTDFEGILYVLLIVPSMMIGFDIILQSSEELNLPPKQIGNVVIISIVGSLIWYIIIILGVALGSTEAIRNAGQIPTADAIADILNSPIFGKVLIIGGIFGILSSWNGFMVAASRLLFALGRAKMIPPIFGTLHPRFKTPVFAIIFVGTICAIAPFLGTNAFLWLVNTSSFGVAVSYFIVSISFILLRRKEPKLFRPFYAKRGLLIATITAIASLVLILLYTPLGLGLIGEQEFFVIIIWFAAGLLLHTYTQSRYSKISPEEREILIMGEKYRRNV